MADIRALLGLFPRTGEYEAKRNMLEEEYKELLAFTETKEYKRFIELRNYLHSGEFLQKKRELFSLKFNKTQDYLKEKQFISQVKSKDIKRYYRTKDSQKLLLLKDIEKSKELQRFLDLEKYVRSFEFQKEKKGSKKSIFKNSEAYQKWFEYNELRKSSFLKSYFKFRSSRDYNTYNSLQDSDRIKKLEELQKYIESEEFVTNKTYYTQSPKKRWKNSEEYLLVKEFEALEKSDKIKWYHKNQESKRFAWHRSWKETFFDDFKQKSLDSTKWITRYYWGDKILKDSYSLSQDKHYVTDGKNLEIIDSMLRIVTKKETVRGKSWHNKYGFVQREFAYTSGLVNTGKSFRQKYGTFEAKILIHPSKDVNNAFWMVSDTMVPHIDVVKANGNIVLGNAWGDAKEIRSVRHFSKNLKRAKFSSDFYIYTMEWTPRKLTWKINGLEVTSCSHGIPQESMYLVFSSGLQKDCFDYLPANMEIDWIRCYQHVNYEQQ